MAEKKKKPGGKALTGHQKPVRPRLKTVYTPAHRAWIIMEPARLALLGSTCITWIAMVIFYLVNGKTLAPMDLLVRVAATFVVSYAGIGLFVCFLIKVANTELWIQQEEAEEVPEPADEDTAAGDEETTAAGEDTEALENVPDLE